MVPWEFYAPVSEGSIMTCRQASYLPPPALQPQS